MSWPDGRASSTTTSAPLARRNPPRQAALMSSTPAPALLDPACGSARSRLVAGHPFDHFGPERPLALQLAEHADARRGHTVDEHVGRRHVELAADVGRA